MEKIEIDERLGIVKVYAPYDRALKELESQGFREIFLVENALFRIQEGKDSNISKYSNIVREDIIYVLGKGTFLTRVPIISSLPEKATKAHRDDYEFYPIRTQIEAALEDSVEITVESIPTNRFNENEITVYAFGTTYGKDISQDEKDAQKYGDFLNDAGIAKMPVDSRPSCFPDRYNVNDQNKSFVRKLSFGGLGRRSGLSGYNWPLWFYDILHGIPKDGVKQKKKTKPKFINPWEIEVLEIKK